MNLRDKTVLVVDHGLYMHLALKLAESFKEVRYYVPEFDPYPELTHDMIGDVKGLKKVYNLFEEIDKEIDLYAFFDVGFADLQRHLQRLHKRVFGAGEGEGIETDKKSFHGLLEAVGLPNEKPAIIKGVDKLREFLRDKKNMFVKISFYRGTFETHEHKDQAETEYFLDTVAAQLGPLKNTMEFLVQKPIESEVEVGYDGFNVEGKYPSNSMVGIEIKDRFYLGCVVNTPPAIVNHVGDRMAQYFHKSAYRGMYSNEIRVAAAPYSKDFKGKPYFIDPTCRAPSPPSELFCEMYAPHCFARAVWDVAEGKLPTLVPQYRWGAEIVLRSEWHDKHALHVKYPKNIEKYVKLKNACTVDGEKWCIPHDNAGYFGNVIGMGSTPREAWSEVYTHFKQIEAQELEDRTECLFDDAMKQFKKMREFGML